MTVVAGRCVTRRHCRHTPTRHRISLIVTRNMRIGLIRYVILEEITDTPQHAGAELLVDARRVPKGEDPGDEQVGIDLLSGHGVDETVQITSLRPSHVPCRVVNSVDFVSGVIAAGTVR